MAKPEAVFIYIGTYPDEAAARSARRPKRRHLEET